MLDPTLAKRIRQQVRSAFDRQVLVTAELVRQPSLMGQEEGAQDVMEREMIAAGLDVDRFPLELDQVEGRHGFSPPLLEYGGNTNVVGVHRGRGQNQRSLVLNGHVDVVPAGPAERWSGDPFSGEVSGGRLHGRGAADMKAGTAACVAAYAAVRRAGVEPLGDIFVQSVIEEEPTGNGTLACVERGYTGDFAIVPEPTSVTLIDAQVGLMWFDRDEYLARFPPRVVPKGQYGEGYERDGGDEAVVLLEQHHRAVTGRGLLRIASGGSSDARILGIDGRTPAVLYGPRGRGYHGYDESVDLDSVLEVTETSALFLAEWCGT